MSLPTHTSTQAWDYNSPHPPALVPADQYPQIPSPASSQYTSESSLSPIEYSYSHLQIPQILPMHISNPSCATVQSYRNHHQSQHLLQHTQLPSLTCPLPQPVFTAKSAPKCPPKSRSTKSSTAASKKDQIGHPYARPYAKKDDVKRRKIWNHAFEKFIFSQHELESIGAVQRRNIYIASLEAHINHMHARLLSMECWPVKREEVEYFSGLNCKTAKSMVSGLQHDSSMFKLKLLELERANGDLQKILSNMPPENMKGCVASLAST